MDRQKILEALGVLRTGLIQMLVVVILMMAVLFPFSKSLLRTLYETNLQDSLVAFSVPEAFLSVMKMSLYGSLFLSVPVIFYRIWKAVAPFFLPAGIKSPAPILLVALFLFYSGALFCFFVTLPFGIRFLLGYQSAQIKPMISVGKYISFCAAFIFAFGLTFELPLVLALLSTVKIVTASFLTRNRRYAILLIAMASAIMTPTPDIFNMALMGGPLYVLFEVGVLLVKIIERKRTTAAAGKGFG